jgi:hypothetical protein
VSEFSEGGLHWWDGTTWVLTAEVLISAPGAVQVRAAGRGRETAAADVPARRRRLDDDPVGYHGSSVFRSPIFFLLYLHRTYKSYRARRLGTLAARPEEVELYSIQRSIGRPLLRVVCRGRQRGIGGSVWIFQPQPVVEAWWRFGRSARQRPGAPEMFQGSGWKQAAR